MCSMISTLSTWYGLHALKWTWMEKKIQINHTKGLEENGIKVFWCFFLRYLNLIEDHMEVYSNTNELWAMFAYPEYRIAYRDDQEFVVK